MIMGRISEEMSPLSEVSSVSGKATKSSKEHLEEVNKETRWEKHPRRSHAGYDKILSRTGELILKGMETVLLADYQREALARR
jgi:hypothetical protein